MPTYTLTSDVLKRLIDINQYDVPQLPLLFIGIRGSLPVSYEDYSFQKQAALTTADINYSQMRCTLVQWKTSDNTIALFPGSTVPHNKYIAEALARQGKGANSLLPAYYKDYRKGIHKAGGPTAHEAFLQTGIRAFRRTADNLTYDNDDRIEFDNPGDNFHAGWCGSLSQDGYASAGCQVVMGYPKCTQRGANSVNLGAWSVFHDNAYAIAQSSFPYLLFNGFEVNAATANTKVSIKLRFGSEGKVVGQLQEKLKEKNFYEGIIDNDFGVRTLRALLAFQKTSFGNEGTDGICGPITAKALGFELPLI